MPGAGRELEAQSSSGSQAQCTAPCAAAPRTSGGPIQGWEMWSLRQGQRGAERGRGNREQELWEKTALGQEWESGPLIQWLQQTCFS